MHANQTSKAQLDHILISGKWINSIENVRAYNCVELNSDHRILSAKVKISLRAPKELKCKRIKYNWSSFIDGSALRAQYEVEVKNRFDILCAENEHSVDTIQAQYDTLVQSIEHTTRKLVPKSRKLRINWVSAHSRDLLQQRDAAKANYRRLKTPAAKKEWKELNTRLDASYVTERRRQISRVETRANAASGCQ